MFIAFNLKKERVSIENADVNCEYFCPICGEKLLIKAKKSLSITPHFAHKKASNCLDEWNHDMSEWHYNWQCLFPEEYREVIVINGGEKHRADVLIDGYVIEFQHSPISGDEIKNRNDFYTKSGYKVVWVFDANNKVKNFYETNGSIDPAKEEDLDWKRERSEFKGQTNNNVSYFIEYNTKVSTNPPQSADIMLCLTELHPKQIKYVQTKNKLKYFYLRRCNFVEAFLHEGKCRSAFEIINECKERSEIQYQPRVTNSCLFQYRNKRKVRF